MGKDMVVNYPKLWAFFLYMVSTGFSIGVLLLIVVFNWEALLNGQGLGSMSFPFFVLYALPTMPLWLIAFVLDKKWSWSTAYWLGILIPVGMFATFPSHF